VFNFTSISIIALAVAGVASAGRIDPGGAATFSSQDGALFTGSIIAGYPNVTAIPGTSATGNPPTIPANDSHFSVNTSNALTVNTTTSSPATAGCPFTNALGGDILTCGAHSYDDFIFADSGTVGSTYTLEFSLASPVTVYGFQIYLQDDRTTDNRGATVVDFFDNTTAVNTAGGVVNSLSAPVTTDTLTTGTNDYATTYGGDGSGNILLTRTFAGVTGSDFSFTFTGSDAAGPRIWDINSIDTAPTPEPGTWMLAGLGMLGLMAGMTMKRRRLQ